MDNIVYLLNSVNHEKIHLFTFKDKTIIAKVVDIIDSNSFIAIFHYNHEIVKYKIRAFGYDSTKINSIEKFKELIGGENAIVRLKCLDFDNNGFILAYIYKFSYDLQNSESINSIMVKEGF